MWNGWKVSDRSPAISKAPTIDSLMGSEGSTARTYFEGFGKMILGGFVFKGRRKHPAPDPVNALLSFGYTLIFNEMWAFWRGLGTSI